MSYDYLTSDGIKSLAPFLSKKMLSTTLNGLWILVFLLIVFWPRKNISRFIYEHEVPVNFLVVFVAALLMNAYVNLRCGRGEIYRDRLGSKLKRERTRTFEEERPFLSFGLTAFFFHTLFLLAILLPPLFISAAVSRVSLEGFMKALSIIFITSFLCRSFGFFVILLWGKEHILGYIATRSFFLFVIFLTGALAGYANPIRLIYGLYRGVDMATPFSMGAYAFYSLTALAAIILLTLTNHLLVSRKIKGVSSP